MDAEINVRELRSAIFNVQIAVEAVLEILNRIHPDTVLGSEETTAKYTDTRICLRPERTPDPIHPSTAACWHDFPIKIGDVAKPMHSISDIVEIILVGLDAVNPNTQLPRRS